MYGPVSRRDIVSSWGAKRWRLRPDQLPRRPRLFCVSLPSPFHFQATPPQVHIYAVKHTQFIRRVSEAGASQERGMPDRGKRRGVVNVWRGLFGGRQWGLR